MLRLWVWSLYGPTELWNITHHYEDYRNCSCHEANRLSSSSSSDNICYPGTAVARRVSSAPPSGGRASRRAAQRRLCSCWWLSAACRYCASSPPCRPPSATHTVTAGITHFHTSPCCSAAQVCCSVPGLGRSERGGSEDEAAPTSRTLSVPPPTYPDRYDAWRKKCFKYKHHGSFQLELPVQPFSTAWCHFKNQ